MAIPSLRSVVLLTAATMVVILLAGLQSANAEPTKARLNLRDCDPKNNGKFVSPSPSNCRSIDVIPKGGTVYINCRYRGSNVEGDYWWLYVLYGNKWGWVADYYVDCGGIVCPYSICKPPKYS